MRSLVVVFVLAVPCLEARSQDPGAQAQASPAPTKQEKDKKKKDAPPPKAAPGKPAPHYTDDDLKKAREEGRGNIVILTSPAGNASAAAEAPDSGKSLEEQRKFWQVQAGQQRQAVANAEGAVRSIEARIGELTNDISPNPGDLLDPSRLQKREAEKQQLLKALEGAKANVEATRKALAEFEEGARQQGIPSSWLQP